MLIHMPNESGVIGFFLDLVIWGRIYSLFVIVHSMVLVLMVLLSVQRVVIHR